MPVEAVCSQLSQSCHSYSSLFLVFTVTARIDDNSGIDYSLVGPPRATAQSLDADLKVRGIPRDTSICQYHCHKKMGTKVLVPAANAVWQPESADEPHGCCTPSPSLSLSSQGEFYSLANRSAVPFSPLPLAFPSDHDRMVYFGASSYFFNTASIAYHRAGALVFEITDAMVSGTSGTELGKRFHLLRCSGSSQQSWRSPSERVGGCGMGPGCWTWQHLRIGGLTMGSSGPHCPSVTVLSCRSQRMRY